MTTIRRSIDLAARAAVGARTEELFRRAGALKEGHFLLKSGRHSERYLEKFLLLQDPAITSELCAFWAAAARGTDGAPLVDVVAGPTTGGIVLAFETARQLGVRGIFAEEVRAADGSTHREFRRGFRIEKGERVLLVDDILTTGGSLLAMLPAVEAAGGEIVGCMVMADRSGGTAVLESPVTGRRYGVQGLWELGDPHLRTRRGDLPALRGRHRALRAGEHGEGGSCGVGRAAPPAPASCASAVPNPTRCAAGVHSRRGVGMGAWFRTPGVPKAQPDPAAGALEGPAAGGLGAKSWLSAHSLSISVHLMHISYVACRRR